jgi:hypothetical protein
MKPSCILMAMLTAMAAIPAESIWAAMVETQTVLESACAHQPRHHLSRILARDDVQAALRARGIDPAEARLRLAGLSDAEVIRLANQIEKLPAGGNGGPWGIFAIAVFVVCVIFILTDLLGVTDFFNIKR